MQCREEVNFGYSSCKTVLTKLRFLSWVVGGVTETVLSLGGQSMVVKLGPNWGGRVFWWANRALRASSSI